MYTFNSRIIPHILQFVLLFISLAFNATQYENNLPYKNSELPIEERIDDLLSRMTLQEKFWQLFMIPYDESDDLSKFEYGIFGLQVHTKGISDEQAGQHLSYAPSGTVVQMLMQINKIQKYFMQETRLGIPIIPFDEALHGLIREGASRFPQSIALAATWDIELMSEVARAIAHETKSRGIRMVLSPVVNIARDVRWGRVEETYGEDPFLTSQMAVAYVKSFERNGVITTPKHFVANIGNGGRDSYPIHFSKRLLNEVYFPAFKSCILHGRSQSIMTAYNSLDGKPCAASSWLLNGILKGEWGFKGFVISDANAVGGILDLHHTVKDRENSAKVAIEGGLDVIFQTDFAHHAPLLRAFKEGLIDVEIINRAVKRVLSAKFRLGLFENPYIEPEPAPEEHTINEHRALTLKAAQKSLVLLKNANSLLPLNKDITSLTIIGQDAVEARLGGYSGPGNNKMNILEGIKNKVSETTKILFAPGCGREYSEFTTIPAQFLSVDNGDEVRKGLQGQYFNNINFENKAVLRRVDSTVNFKWTLFAAHPELSTDWYSVRWTGNIHVPQSGIYQIGVEGNDGFRLYIDSILVIDNWQKRSYRRITIPQKFDKEKKYSLRLDFYENRGNGSIRLIWNRNANQKIYDEIERAVTIARESDLVIVVAGIEEGEFQDRANIQLPGLQEEMIKQISATGTPVVVVLIGGSAIEMINWIDDVPAVLDAWYPGDMGGQAVADVLFGDYNPGGKLPVTFPLSVAQVPLYYNHKPTGRGDDYINMSGFPLFPFGHGLSYTTFSYEALDITPQKIAPDGEAQVRFILKNTGKVGGEEVVQLYIRDLVASVTRPVIELKGFQRLYLNAGEQKEVFFTITPDLLSMWDQDMNFVVEPGSFQIMLGSSSSDIRLKGILHVLDESITN